MYHPFHIFPRSEDYLRHDLHWRKQASLEERQRLLLQLDELRKGRQKTDEPTVKENEVIGKLSDCYLPDK